MKKISGIWTIVLNSCGVVTLDNRVVVYYLVMKKGRILYDKSGDIPKNIKKMVIQFFMDNLDQIKHEP